MIEECLLIEQLFKDKVDAAVQWADDYVKIAREAKQKFLKNTFVKLHNLITISIVIYNNIIIMILISKIQ